MPLKAIIFDLDDTLVHSTRAYATALQAAEIAEAPFLKARQAVKSRLPPQHVAARNRLLYFKAMLPFAPQRLMATMQAYEEALERSIQEQWEALGRQALLAALASRYTLVVLTNENTRTQLLKMRAIDPQARWCRTCITSEEMGVEKPDPRMFMQAFAAAEARPQECLMVGDSVEQDMRPAQRLGAQALLTTQFVSPGDGTEELPQIDDLEQLRAQLL